MSAYVFASKKTFVAYCEFYSKKYINYLSAYILNGKKSQTSEIQKVRKIPAIYKVLVISVL